MFVAAYAISVVLAVPTLPLNVAAGALWGTIIGAIVSTFGMTFGAVIAFASARFVFGQPLTRHFDVDLVRWVQNEFDSTGWRSVAFVRLNPAFPAGPLNYLFGLTSLDFRTYVWSTFVFLAPPATLIAFIGESASNVWDEQTLRAGFSSVVLISFALAFIIALRYCAKYLKRRHMYDCDVTGPHA